MRVCEALGTALRLLADLDPKLVEIVLLSLGVSLPAVVIAALCWGFRSAQPSPSAGSRGARPRSRASQRADGAAAGGRRARSSTCCCRAPARSARSGILFTPTAMVIAQTILILPIIAALSRQVDRGRAGAEYEEQLRSLGARRARARR